MGSLRTGDSAPRGWSTGAAAKAVAGPAQDPFLPQERCALRAAPTPRRPSRTPAGGGGRAGRRQAPRSAAPSAGPAEKASGPALWTPVGSDTGAGDRGQPWQGGTHHVDFGNHVYAGDVDVHPHADRGTCRKRKTR